jgi:hypothetical protein
VALSDLPGIHVKPVGVLKLGSSLGRLWVEDPDQTKEASGTQICFPECRDSSVADSVAPSLHQSVEMNLCLVLVHKPSQRMPPRRQLALFHKNISSIDSSDACPSYHPWFALDLQTHQIAHPSAASTESGFVHKPPTISWALHLGCQSVFSNVNLRCTPKWHDSTICQLDHEHK